MKKTSAKKFEGEQTQILFPFDPRKIQRDYMTQMESCLETPNSHLLAGIGNRWGKTQAEVSLILGWLYSKLNIKEEAPAVQDSIEKVFFVCRTPNRLDDVNES